MTLYILENDPIVPAGYLGDLLRDRATPSATIQLHAGDRLPELEQAAAVVLLGGTMGVYDERQYPYLTEEKAFVGAAVAAGIPTLGICLGCQLLAEALGGRAYLAPRVECRFDALDLTSAGSGDSIMASFRKAAVLSWHQDTWDLPPGAELLARSPEYPQAFRLGSALGIQPHPEATPEIVAGWASSPVGAAMLRSVGVAPEELVATLSTNRQESEKTARSFFAGWLDAGDI